MKDYSKDMEAKENSSEATEVSATLVQDPTLIPRARVSNITNQYDSEGMCLEE